ncbi:hypothetical protein BFP70_06300 [Thioclava sp. SK-1]|uniref:IclR family transcriptional regulator domain-containing protein n=1 Tax=Thioclava sp. SK-1 TaxID=1889770 RepID=UPI00082640FE|nr:IclR family transcriptional regulator C-terminal domain-containing protein [Thioclava sp. SK-1]OCX65753.1 hypothetical protein BFP70_06300 [Thioclava sp. SK-1]
MANQPLKTENVASVLKVFAVLETLSDERSASLASIAQRAMTSKSTTHRLLQTMVELGYVEQHEDTEHYGLTLKLFAVAARAIKDQSALIQTADKAMGVLSRATGESINLGILDEVEQRVVYIHQRRSAFSLSMNCTIGQRNPIHCTSLGKALLAFRDEIETDERMSKMDFTPCAPRTIANAEAFRACLQKARTQGFAEEVEEAEAGVRCMAAPVLDHLGHSIAAISMSFPLFRYAEDKRDEYIDLLTSQARAASHAMGWDG